MSHIQRVLGTWSEGTAIAMSTSLHLVGLFLAYLGSCELGTECLVLPCPVVIEKPALPPEPMDPPPPLVAVRVRVAACAAPGQELDYCIKVENGSPAAAHHVVVKHTLPANVKLVRASPEPNKKDPDLQWNLGTLRGGGHQEITLVLLPTNEEDVLSCTRVQFEHGQCVTTRIARAPLPAPEEVPTPPTPLKPGEPLKPERPPVIKEIPSQPTPPQPTPEPKAGKAKLSLTMTGPKQQYLNHPARYHITVVNQGTASATNVMITNQVPDKLTFIKASAPGKFLEDQVAWLLGTLNPGKSQTVEIVVQAKDAGEFCHKAAALADGGLKAQTELCTAFRGVTALSLEVVDRIDPVEVNGETSYPIVVHNQGTAAATNVRIRAIIPAAMAVVRAKGATDNRLGDRTADGGQVLLFDPLPNLAPGAKAEFEVFTKALRPGDVRFKVELTADQLKEGGPVHEEESTTIFLEAAPTREPPLEMPPKEK